MKNQNYKNKVYKSSSEFSPEFACLGTVEADASGHYGMFVKKEFLGKDAIDKIISFWKVASTIIRSCLPRGAGTALPYYLPHSWWQSPNTFL